MILNIDRVCSGKLQQLQQTKNPSPTFSSRTLNCDTVSFSSTLKKQQSQSLSFEGLAKMIAGKLSFGSQEKISKKTIRDLPDVKGKKVLMRVDFNVPLDENRNITDDTRIKGALPTIKNLRDRGAKVILMTHLGRPKGQVKEEMRLDPVAVRLGELLNQEVKKLDDCVGEEVTTAVNEMKNGDVTLLENLRFHKEETDNDPMFAKQLASLADVYVNDAFGTAHRAHASTQGVTENVDNCVAGLLMEKEILNLGKVINNAEAPFVAILGGAKVSSKIGAIENLMDKVDNLVLSGGMTYTFLKAQDCEVGTSRLEEDNVEVAKEILEKAKQKNVEIILAEDIVVADKFDANAKTKVVSAENMPADMMGLDVGPESIADIKNALSDAKTVVWNGPLGVFEMDAFDEGTKAVAQAVAEITAKNNAKTILGGGDTVAALEKFGIAKDSFTHVSTGGGASLEMLEGKELPGIASLDDAA